jgi:hypothetical protein
MNVHFMSAPVGFSAAINLMNAADPSSFETFVSSDIRRIHMSSSMADTQCSYSRDYINLYSYHTSLLLYPLFRWGRCLSRSA